MSDDLISREGTKQAKVNVSTHLLYGLYSR